MKILKWIGIVVLSLVVILAACIAFVLSSGKKKANATVDVTVAPVAIPTDSAAIARGRHLADAINKCSDCHGADFGGVLVIDGLPFMRLAAPNLTRGRGGIGGTFTDTDWVRALRHGVSRDGRKLAMMPSEAYTHMDDADLGAVIAFIKSVPAVDRELPAKEYGPIARALLVAGKFPMHVYDYIDHSRRTVTARTAESDTVGYGRYLAVIGGCSICHGANLAGGRQPTGPPEGPIPSNLTPAGIGHYTEADFVRALREGMKPGGVAIDSAMPWRSSGRMTDAEIHAVWTFLRSLPPVETPPATQ